MFMNTGLSQTQPQGASVRDVNYINIFMQQPTQSTQTLGGALIPKEEGALFSTDHTSQIFYEQLDRLIKQTPLQDIIKEGIEKEKRKFPQFLYHHPGSSSGAPGDDIGFEDNNAVREAQSRTHAKLLDSLLQDILTGKFRDTHWLSGIEVHRQAETHWQHGVL